MGKGKSHDGLATIFNEGECISPIEIFNNSENTIRTINRRGKEMLLRNIKEALPGINARNIEMVELEAVKEGDKIYFRCYKNKPETNDPLVSDMDFWLNALKKKLTNIQKRNNKLSKDQRRDRIAHIENLSSNLSTDDLSKLILEYAETDEDWNTVDFYVQKLISTREISVKNDTQSQRDPCDYGYFVLDGEGINSLNLMEG